MFITVCVSVLFYECSCVCCEKLLVCMYKHVKEYRPKFISVVHITFKLAEFYSDLKHLSFLTIVKLLDFKSEELK